jgi:hypothetical protein
MPDKLYKHQVYLFGRPTEDVLSRDRRSHISVFCEHTLTSFANVMQAGKYALKVLSISGDGADERCAILRELWDYHRRLKTYDIPF